ncbi:MAG: imidazole glycerol phosphate synthase subunit HisH [Dehalococcoidales bacterium]|jgi:glutamine amidotransferase|nr:imidazole glycerol phosphate synthase subunit HisH [Dehalococcoidales bacterium]MDD3265301.1 imidazole glycerol phosphate synthase subunit HisH [Dehalococcoidales bacterium]MDD4322910.1 imidazole glycerol phosphate synthase subunit HisH [Dehalococcoidales bacterium]MDD4794632.1 imidazole glycerol phosphate synthase subunit HisH [Dehalococcoidales bacterium]MDD5122031.1 imidazole glycerol phosphate synthase subunit HisH [Dehalococcoidales bacterium]
MIAVIDYGAGNIKSVLNAVWHLGFHPVLTSSPGEVLKADKVIFPGVGAAESTMASLKTLELDKAIREYASSGKPFLGICIGMQVLFDYAEEGGGCECLGIIPGRVKKLPSGQKIPHMGWNQVHQVKPHQIFSGIEDSENFYFVHSYYVQPDDEQHVIARTLYGLDFCCAIAREELVATQFHPEKSGKNGLKVYENFLSGCSGEEG